MADGAKIIELRQLLEGRFPGARPRPQGATENAGRWSTGVPALDECLGGGLPRGGSVELVGARPDSGTAMIIHSLIDRTARAGGFTVLIDGRDSFDVDAEPPEVLAHLLWVRCHHASEALKAADVVLRDRNMPLVVIDLKMNPASELRKISASAWPRLDRLREYHGTTLVVVTPEPMVGLVHQRIAVSRRGTSTTGLEPGALHFELLRETSAAQRKTG